jgi:hypothetical protein
LSSNIKHNKIIGVINTFKKTVPASSSGIALSIIKNVYAHAIEYRGIPNSYRGVPSLLALMCIGLFSIGVIGILPLGGGGKTNLFTIITDIIFFLCIAIVTLYLVLKCMRFELFRPEDEPIIFDRGNKKVYRIFSEVIPGWKGLFVQWPLRTAEYDWNLIEAEHHAAINANTATVSRLHALVFTVKKSLIDPTIIDGFTIGNSMQSGEVIVPAVYEHIRKFMEENGPHVPLGETMAESIATPTFFESLARTGPYGDTLKTWWKNARYLTLLGLIFFPITFPIVTLLGIFSWLSYITATPINWPNTVLKAIGPPLTQKIEEY